MKGHVAPFSTPSTCSSTPKGPTAANVVVQDDPCWHALQCRLAAEADPFANAAKPAPLSKDAIDDLSPELLALLPGGTSTAQLTHQPANPCAQHAATRSSKRSNRMLLASSSRMPASMARDSWRMSHYTIRKQLSSGYASNVYQATCRKSGQDVALKVYRTSRQTELGRHQMTREIHIHSQLSHPNIVQLYAAFQEGDITVLVEEYAQGGDLYNFLNRHMGCLSEPLAVDVVLRPLLEAVQYLHSRGIMHRDIKLENILLSQEHVVKLADFGLAIDVIAERAVTRAGTIEYMAPEVIRCPPKEMPGDNKGNVELGYGMSADAWSIGVLAYELVMGCAPFTAEACLDFAEVIRSYPPDLPEVASGSCRAFISHALRRFPGDRPTVAEMLQSPWIRTHRAKCQERSTSMCEREVSPSWSVADIDRSNSAIDPVMQWPPRKAVQAVQDQLIQACNNLSNPAMEESGYVDDFSVQWSVSNAAQGQPAHHRYDYHLAKTAAEGDDPANELSAQWGTIQAAQSQMTQNRDLYQILPEHVVDGSGSVTADSAAWSRSNAVHAQLQRCIDRHHQRVTAAAEKMLQPRSQPWTTRDGECAGWSAVQRAVGMQYSCTVTTGHGEPQYSQPPYSYPAYSQGLGFPCDEDADFTVHIVEGETNCLSVWPEQHASHLQPKQPNTDVVCSNATPGAMHAWNLHACMELPSMHGATLELHAQNSSQLHMGNPQQAVPWPLNGSAPCRNVPAAADAGRSNVQPWPSSGILMPRADSNSQSRKPWSPVLAVAATADSNHLLQPAMSQQLLVPHPQLPSHGEQLSEAMLPCSLSGLSLKEVVDPPPQHHDHHAPQPSRAFERATCLPPPSPGDSGRPTRVTSLVSLGFATGATPAADSDLTCSPMVPRVASCAVLPSATTKADRRAHKQIDELNRVLALARWLEGQGKANAGAGM